MKHLLTGIILLVLFTSAFPSAFAYTIDDLVGEWKCHLTGNAGRVDIRSRYEIFGSGEAVSSGFTRHTQREEISGYPPVTLERRWVAAAKRIVQGETVTDNLLKFITLSLTIDGEPEVPLPMDISQDPPISFDLTMSSPDEFTLTNEFSTETCTRETSK